MKNFLALSGILCLITLASCKLEEKQGFFIDKQLDLYYVTQDGKDLLDSTVAGSYRTDSIHVYEYNGGVKQEAINNVNYPRGFLYLRNDFTGKYAVRIFPETEVSIIELNASTFDTIRCTFEKTDHQFIITSVRYNGNLRWDDIATAREVIVVK
jgi:hypothetical protein